MFNGLLTDEQLALKMKEIQQIFYYNLISVYYIASHLNSHIKVNSVNSLLP